ncbi:radical SAM protein [Oricola sp.]|uniref:radical SAM protein n=1 Tax=Oricola sp. TaxID=1979950 RepID=UPI0025CBBBE6|nr:radical SAM protein [Oricola sp.]MCI5077468.1 radical SAM protein [Oricola sp.]
MNDLAPIELVILQGTPFCNLNCTYCDLSAASRRIRQVMEPELIERVFTELFTSGLAAGEVTVVWHSGEPLTLPPDYYDRAITQIEALRTALVGDAVSMRYDIQTNAVLIDAAWCDLFRRHARHMKIGVSCDGPEQMHDAYRTNWGGKASHAKVVRGMDLLAAHGIPYKVIAVVTDKALADPRAFYDFFNARRAELSGFHFNILASGDGESPDLSYGSADRQRYYDFYRTLLAYAAEADGLGIQNFTQGLGRILRAGDAGSRYMEETSAPLKALNVDVNGYVTTCYAGLAIDTLPDAYGDGLGLSIGNIKDTSLVEMARSDKLRRIIGDFESSTAHCLRTCEYAGVCSGGFEITQRLGGGSFEAGETAECVIHVKALTDALLDDVDDHLVKTSRQAAYA